MLPSQPTVRADQAAAEFSLTTPSVEAPEPTRAIDLEAFESLTVAEAMSGFFSRPRETMSAFASVAREDHPSAALPARSAATAGSPAQTIPRPAGRSIQVAPEPTRVSQDSIPPDVVAHPVIALSRGRELGLLLLRGFAVFVAWIGANRMVLGERSEDDGLAGGIVPLLAGLVIWLISEFVYLAVRRSADDEGFFRPFAIVARPAAASLNALWYVQRAAVLGVAGVLAFFASTLNTNNQFTLPGIAVWFASIVLTVTAFLPWDWSPVDWLRAVGRALRPRFSWALVALVVIMVVGSIFRVYDLNAMPREMTSDHVEMILDVFNVRSGNNSVFFASNGGREAMQFYLFAAFAQFPGQSVGFETLKLLNVIEGILTIPVMFFMAREVVGRERQQFATLVGLAAAALVATSFWHEVLSRQGERIILTPLFTALFILFFTRAIRYRRRMDWLYSGIVLGFGLYTYQAFRMIPVVIIAGVLLAMLFNLRDRAALRHYVGNLFVMVMVAFVIFVPLFSFSLQYPEDFWRRTTGRLFGDDLIEDRNADGEMVLRDPTLTEQLEAFNENIPQLMTNYRNAFLMFNWKGDVSFFNNAPNQPAFDPLTGAILVCGVAAWIGYMIRKRDVMIWLMPGALVILMLPSALSIAFPNENPSATRMSATLPIVYLFAALALSWLLWGIVHVIRGRAGWIIAAGAGALVMAGSLANNFYRYFTLYPEIYIASAFPYSDIGAAMRTFAEEIGGWGNVFVINYPYSWDHRALGIEGGAPDYPNGIPELSQVPTWLRDAANRDGAYRLIPDFDLLFVYNSKDEITQEWLVNTFPAGSWAELTTYQPEDPFRIFRVPALGEDGFDRFLAQTLGQQG